MAAVLPEPLAQVCERERRSAARRGTRVLACCALVLIPLLALLDALVFLPADLPLLRAWRLATFVGTAAVLLLLRTRVGARWPLPLGVAVALMVGANADAMTRLPTASSSPYYAVVIVVLLTASILLPWSPRWALGVAGLLVATYVSGSLLPGPPADLLRFAGDAFLVAATGFLAVLAAASQERSRREELRQRFEVDAHARYHEAVAKLGQLGLAEVETSLLMDRAVEMIAETLGVEYVSLLEVTPDRQALILRAGVGWKQPRKERRPLGAGDDTLLGHLLRTHEPTIVEDVRAETRFQVPSLLRSHGVVSSANVVIAGGERPLGVLGAHASKRRAFTRRDVEFLQAVSRVIATAILHRAARDAQVEDTETSTALARVGRELIASLDGPGLHARLCRLTAEVLGCEVSTTWVLDPTANVYRSIEGHGLDSARWKALQATPIPADVAQGLIERLRTAGVLEVAADGELPFLRRAFGVAGIGRALLVALRDDDVVVGIQATGHLEASRSFTASQKRIVVGTAQLASVALINARLVEELERANRLKTEFVATMSHELRSPLNVIIGYADMLGDEPPAEQRAALLTKLRTSAIDLLELIETTMNLNRMAAGPAALSREQVEVGRLFESLAADFAAVHRGDAVALRWHADEGASLRTDRRKLTIVLRNLVDNALKFTTAGEVVVECRGTGPALVLTVRDSGPGIPPDRLSSIFDMFSQLDGPDAPASQGVGLGLYIVQRLVRQLGGGVEVESEVGRGTTFRVTLPQAWSPATAAPPAAAAEHGHGIGFGAPNDWATLSLTRARQNALEATEVARASLPEDLAPRRKRLLFADDLPLNRTVLERVLRLEMPEVEMIEAADGTQAVAMVEARHPDLVLMDLYMPQMDGWEATRRIRQLPGMEELPIIALSATAGPESEALALKAGCNEFLPKPISDYRKLKERIAYWLGLTPPAGERPPADGPHCSTQ
jgi:signal transduction histidine kinase/putative methionine-R-sulfoxide reductase with GAF domain